MTCELSRRAHRSHVSGEPESPVSAFATGITCEWPDDATPSQFSQIDIWEMACDNLGGYETASHHRARRESSWKTTTRPSCAAVRDARGYVEQVTETAERLVEEGFLLPDAAGELVARQDSDVLG